MKITSVKAIPASHSTTRVGIKTSRNYVFVKIETDEGITGWGAATCGPLRVATLADSLPSFPCKGRYCSDVCYQWY